MSKSILIIGAGIGGLSAGCYAQRNGFHSEVVEMNATAGGLCTGWKRKDFTFDGCLHWLVGTQPGTEFYRLWSEIGAVQDMDFHYYEYFTRYTDLEGNEFIAYGDPDRLRDHLISIAPEDARLIRRFTADIKTIMKQDMPVDFNLKAARKALPSLLMMIKYRMPLSKFAAKFRNPLLRKLFIDALDWHDMPAAFIFWTMALMGAKKAGYPIGGSRGLIRSVVDNYEALGGKIHYGKKVETLLVEHHQVVGVRFEDGSEQRADYTISAADGHRTIFEWLEGKYVNSFIKKCYSTLELFPALVYVSLGLRKDFADEPYAIQFQLKKPVRIGSEDMKSIGIRNHWFDKTLSPPGKGIFTMLIQQDYSWWEKYKTDRDGYLKQKELILEQVITLLEERFPDIRQEIEVSDISTPLTFERYTGNWKASYEGWLMKPDNISLQLPQVLPGLSNFYMAGHWISPGGGLPSGLITGRKAIQKICKKERVRFR